MNYSFVALMVATCGYALVAGGGPERIGAATFMIASHLTFIVGSASRIEFQSIEAGILVIDVVTFVVFAALALRADRFWPIWVSALVGMSVLGHLARYSDLGIGPWTYAVSIAIWSYPALTLMAIGTRNHQLRVAHFGTDRSWSTQSGYCIQGERLSEASK